MTGTATGTGTLLRFVLRRDRVRIPVWTLAITGSLLASASSLPSLFPTQADRQDRAELMENPALIALSGPGYGTDNYTYGAMIANEYLSFAAIFVALMSILLVTRHTRAEEESGSAELVRATAVGRHAMTTATVIAVAATNLVIGALAALGLPLVVEDLSFSSSVLFGASLAAIGLVFTGVAAVAAQVTEYPRAANGMAGAVLGAAFVLRGVGDIGNGAVTWLSPIGWSQATKVYVDDRWWPLGISVLVAAGTTAAAFALNTRRDLGGGMFSQRPGRPTASEGLMRPIGFALRLQRASLVAWAVGLLLAGITYGSLSDAATDFVERNEIMQDFLGLGDLTQAELAETDVVSHFFVRILTFFAALATGYALMSALRLRSEENAGRVEPLLATALSRWRWAGSHLVMALAGTAALLVVGGLGLGVTTAITLSDSGQVLQLLGAALAHVPSVWLTVGIAVALFGLVPRASQWAWAVLAYGAFISMYGPVLNVPDWAHNLSPLGHTPDVPVESADPVPLGIMTAIAAALLWAGLYGFRRRDIEMS